MALKAVLSKLVMIKSVGNNVMMNRVKILKYLFWNDHEKNCLIQAGLEGKNRIWIKDLSVKNLASFYPQAT